MRGSDVTRALVEVINAAGVGRAVPELPLGFENMLPVHLVYRTGGRPEDADRGPRYAVQTYGRGIDATEKAVEDVRKVLAWAGVRSNSYHFTSYGMLDDVTPDGEPNSIPYSDTTKLMSLTYLVDFRE